MIPGMLYRPGNTACHKPQSRFSIDCHKNLRTNRYCCCALSDFLCDDGFMCSVHTFRIERANNTTLSLERGPSQSYRIRLSITSTTFCFLFGRKELYRTSLGRTHNSRVLSHCFCEFIYTSNKSTHSSTLWDHPRFSPPSLPPSSQIHPPNVHRFLLGTQKVRIEITKPAAILTDNSGEHSSTANQSTSQQLQKSQR